MRPQSNDLIYWRPFLKPIEWLVWALLVFALGWIQFQAQTLAARFTATLFLLGVALYMLLFFHWFLPREQNLRRWGHLTWVISVLVVAGADYWLGSYNIEFAMLYVVVVAIVGGTAGSRAAFVATLLAVAADGGIILLRGERHQSLWQEMLHLPVLLMAGYGASVVASVQRRRAVEADRQSRELALILNIRTAISTSLDFPRTMPQLAELIVNEMPAAFCHICLLERDQRHLTTLGFFARKGALNPPAVEPQCALAELPQHRQAIASVQVFHLSHAEFMTTLSHAEDARAWLAPIQMLYLVSLRVNERVLGTLVIGMDDGANQDMLDLERVGLVKTIAAQVADVIYKLELYQTMQRQAKRMTVLNEVARTIGSTIEMDALLELIYQQLSRVIPTDTYYVALYNASAQTVDLRILYDEGQRFPAHTQPLGNGLVNTIVRERRALLCRELAHERETLNIQTVVVGQPRQSESWLGAPILLGDEPLGVLVVASYQPRAFDQDDLALLSNIAMQAALALDNARHHAEVEAQARRDSLTGVFNHGYLLERLHQAVGPSCTATAPVSFIMLDIDYFKTYNDTYGHVLGDQVLRLTVQAIERHVKLTDSIGRWGGEEFGIVLPNTTIEQARQIAERIRTTLAELPLVDSHGHPIPKPTVSQGIATCPTHAHAAEELIDLADRTLYQAKAQGRDQVRVADPTR